MWGIFPIWTGLSIQNSLESNIHYAKETVMKIALFFPIRNDATLQSTHNTTANMVKEEEK